MPSNFSELRLSTPPTTLLVNFTDTDTDTVTITPTQSHRHRHRHKFSTLDFDRLTAITDRHEFVLDSSNRYTDRLSSSTRTRHTHSYDLRSVSDAYFLTRSRLPYAPRRHRSCTQTEFEADTERGCRSDHRSHPLIPVISGLAIATAAHAHANTYLRYRSLAISRLRLLAMRVDF
jgi:hypothetical protein